LNLRLPFMNGQIIGDSPAMRALDRQIATAARCDLTALVTGESGTGKELVARAIHEQSDRKGGPFISINCGALTEALLESELFGYERGAFTGASQKRKGLFEAADKGTILLDEIGEMTAACQVRLLRVLQENAVRPIGAHTEVSIDVRVVAATNRRLAREVAAGRFREDLFYRIAVLRINIPPLRERSSDIPLLVQHFLRRADEKMKCVSHQIEAEAVDALSRYSWPGNVRQVRHIVEGLAAMTENEFITAEAVHGALYGDLPALESAAAAYQLPLVYTDDDSLDDILDRAIIQVYEQLRAQSRGHAEVARRLRMHRSALYTRLERARHRLQRSKLA
jgi:transcriptional regulator with PAS, ATPase and Fis domain